MPARCINISSSQKKKIKIFSQTSGICMTLRFCKQVQRPLFLWVTNTFAAFLEMAKLVLFTSSSDSDAKSTCNIKRGLISPPHLPSWFQRAILHLSEVFQERMSDFPSRGIRTRLSPPAERLLGGSSDVGWKSGEGLFYPKLLWVLWHSQKPEESYVCLL